MIIITNRINSTCGGLAVKNTIKQKNYLFDLLMNGGGGGGGGGIKYPVASHTVTLEHMSRKKYTDPCLERMHPYLSYTHTSTLPSSA